MKWLPFIIVGIVGAMVYLVVQDFYDRSAIHRALTLKPIQN